MVDDECHEPVDQPPDLVIRIVANAVTERGRVFADCFDQQRQETRRFGRTGPDTGQGSDVVSERHHAVETIAKLAGSNKFTGEDQLVDRDDDRDERDRPRDHPTGQSRHRVVVCELDDVQTAEGEQ